MSNKTEWNHPPVDRQLRAGAEARLAGKHGIDADAQAVPAARLLHELQVHQIELEMQNESLQEAQLELERSRDRYLDLYDFAPVGYCSVNLKGVLTEANLMAAKLFGHHRAHLIGKPLIFFVTADNKDVVRSLLHNVPPQLRREVPEICLLHSNGTHFYARLDCLYVRSDKGLSEAAEEMSIRLAISNLGALSTAEREQLENENRYRALYESMRDAFVLFDMSGKVKLFNSTFENMMGYSVDELKRKNHIDLTPVKWHSSIASLLEEAVREGESNVFEKECIRKDGTIFPVELKTVLLKDKNGGPEGMWAVVRDISQRKRAEAELVASESRFRLAMQAITGFTYDWNIESDRLVVSEGVTELLGLSFPSTSTIADWLPDYVHPEDWPLLQAQVVQSWKKQADRYQMLVRLRHKEGHWLHISIRALMAYDAHGRAVRMVGSCTDVSAQVKAELSLHQANDSLEEQVLERSAELRGRLNELKESERFTRTTLDAISAAVIVIDENGRSVFSNLAWRDFVEKQGDLFCEPMKEGMLAETSYLPCGQVCKEHSAECSAHNKIQKAISSMFAGKRKTQSAECSVCIGTQVRWFLVKITRFRGDSAERLVVTYNDITERKLAADDLARVIKSFKAMLRKMELVNEENNKQLAREVHDQLGATLTMLKLGLATSKKADASDSSRTLNTKIDGMIDLANLALQSAKRVTASLRPSMLETMGLVAAIEWHTKEFSRMTGIRITLEIPETIKLAAERENAVFRIVQEALTNVGKHAAAAEVNILIRRTRRDLIVTVSDNGKGLLPDNLQRQNSFGVIGMQERAQYLGGKLSLAGRPEGGTVMLLKIPIVGDNKKQERPLAS